MPHPNEGALRRLLDEPLGVADDDRQHVAGCPVCLADLAAAREDAAAAAALLGGDVDVDVDAAWQRLSQALAVEEPRPVVVPRRRRISLRNPLVAGLGAVAVLTGAGAAAAADWVQIFRTEQLAPVTVTQADLVELPDLSTYGDLQVTGEPDVREVANAAAAEQVAGLPVPRVDDLPQGVTGQPTYQVGDRVTAVFTFSAQKAAQAAAAAGETLPPPPPGLDGSRFRLSAGPGVAAVWSEGRGIPALVVARATAPTAESDSGVSFSTARDYLLSLPGVSDALAAQLRSFSGDGTTLPLPVPAQLVESSETNVDGMPARLLNARDGSVAGVVWVQDGVVTTVAGSLGADEVLDVARGLQ